MDEDLVALRENRGIKQRLGTFRNANELDGIVTPILTAAAVIMYIAAVFLIEIPELFAAIASFFWNSTADESIYMAMGVVLVPPLVAVSVALGLYSGGKEWHWETNAEALILTRGKEKIFYYYTDVISVIYEQYGHRGWRVVVTTEFREETWRMLIGTRKIYREFEETPFFILMQNCGLASPDGISLQKGDLPAWVDFSKFDTGDDTPNYLDD